MKDTRVKFPDITAECNHNITYMSHDIDKTIDSLNGNNCLLIYSMVFREVCRECGAHRFSYFCIDDVASHVEQLYLQPVRTVEWR